MPVPGVSISVTIDTLVEELRPTIEPHRDEADRLGRLRDQVVAELRDAGAFRLYLPRELGGAELSLRATLEALEGVGRIDGATAWTPAAHRRPHGEPLSSDVRLQGAIGRVRPGLPTGEPFVC